MGTKLTAVIWLGVVMWFPSSHVHMCGAGGEGDNCLQGTREEDAGWSPGACASSQGEITWDGRAWGWLLTWGQ